MQDSNTDRQKHLAKNRASLYGGEDPREMPAYRIVEAAHYLRIPRTTLNTWVKGHHYQTQRGRQFSKPLIILPEPSQPLLSFLNIVEVHVLNALRRDHGVSMPKVRSALDYLENNMPSNHPLIDQEFETDGMDIFISKYGQLINLNEDGQVILRGILSAYLKRIERDTAGLPVKLYIFSRDHRSREHLDAPKHISIDPYVSFGRPVITGTGLPTAIVAERYSAGESHQDLAKDYRVDIGAIEEAIRCELHEQVA